MITTSIARKVAMALSGLFLILFLGQHFTINITSVFSEKTFNFISHFMGNNPVVQFILQPVLIFGVIFHFVMGFVLQIKNSRSRSVKYVSFNGSANINLPGVNIDGNQNTSGNASTATTADLALAVPRRYSAGQQWRMP